MMIMNTCGFELSVSGSEQNEVSYLFVSSLFFLTLYVTSFTGDIFCSIRQSIGCFYSYLIMCSLLRLYYFDVMKIVLTCTY